MQHNTYAKEFSEIIHKRRSVRIFDQKSVFNHDIVTQCLDLATLSPNSSNLQLWEFYRVKESSSKFSALVKLCMGQKAAKTSRELVVVVARRDLWKSRAKANYAYIEECYKDADPKKQKQALSYYGNLIPKLYSKYPGWSLLKKGIAFAAGLGRPMVREVSETAVRISVHKSVALAAMTFMHAMTAHGYDTCPMEGFDSKRVKKLLNLPAPSEISMIIACGKGLPEGIYGERFRIPNMAIIHEIP